MRAAGEAREIRRQFLALCAQAVLFQAAVFLIRPTASYRAIELGVPSGWLGVLAAAFAVVPLAVALPAGDAVDRWGEKRVLLGGAMVIVLAATVFAVGAGSFSILLLATALLGAGHLLCVVGQQALVANLMPARHLDSAYGYYTFAGALGQAAGPGLLGLFDGDGALPATGHAFLAGVGLGVLLLAVTFVGRSTLAHGRPRLTRAERRVTSLLRIPHLARAMVVSGIVLASMEITLVYLPAVGAEGGLSVRVVSGLLTARALASMVSRFLVGRLSDLVGRRLLLTSAIATTGASTALLTTPGPLLVVFTAAAALGFGFGMCQPVTLSWLAEISPAGSRGRVMSMRITGNRLAQITVPSSVGLVATGLGAAGVLWFTAAITIAAAGLARSVPLDRVDPPIGGSP